MPEESNKGGKIAEVVDAVSGLIDKVPIYPDAIQPAAKEVGKGLTTLAKAVNTALIPVEGLIWGVEKIRDFVRERVESKLKNIPPEDVQPPKPHVGVPTIEALRYTGSEPDLSEMYANLLATSMDKATAYKAHPCFVDMIKNMSPDEARIMKYLAVNSACPLINIKSVSNIDQSYRELHRRVSLLGLDAMCEHVPLTPNYIDNLERLGLIQVDTAYFFDPDVYSRIEDYPQIKDIKNESAKAEGRRVEIEKLRMIVTDLGRQFIQTCVINKSVQQRV